MNTKFRELKKFLQYGNIDEVRQLIIETPKLLTFIDENGDNLFTLASKYLHQEPYFKPIDLLVEPHEPHEPYLANEQKL